MLVFIIFCGYLSIKTVFSVSPSPSPSSCFSRTFIHFLLPFYLHVSWRSFTSFCEICGPHKNKFKIYFLVVAVFFFLYLPLFNFSLTYYKNTSSAVFFSRAISNLRTERLNKPIWKYLEWLERRNKTKCVYTGTKKKSLYHSQREEYCERELNKKKSPTIREIMIETISTNTHTHICRGFERARNELGRSAYFRKFGIWVYVLCSFSLSLTYFLIQKCY